MVTNNSANVTAGTPKVGGAFFHAPLGTDLPTDAKTALDAAFKNLGYISEDGLTESTSIDTSTVKAWGGDVVMVNQTGKTTTFSLTLIEALNEEVQKYTHGADNVTGNLTTGMTVKNASGELEPEVLVVEQIMNGNVLKRTVIPNGKITDIGDISYKDGEPVGYNVTITASVDSTGTASYDYYIKQGE